MCMFLLCTPCYRDGSSWGAGAEAHTRNQGYSDYGYHEPTTGNIDEHGESEYPPDFNSSLGGTDDYAEQIAAGQQHVDGLAA